MDKNTSFSELVSKYRSSIMGICIVFIMLFHNEFGVLGPFAYPFKNYGHWGVDVFLFVSGFGLYYSLNQDKAISRVSFYKRRLVRIMPAAVLAGGGLYVLGKTDVLGLFGLNLWYIRTLLLLYILAPVSFRFLKRYNPSLVLLIHVLLLGVAGVLIFVPLLYSAPWSLQTTLTWTFARLPAFAVGMYVARMGFCLRHIFSLRYLIFALLCLLSAAFCYKIRFEMEVFSIYMNLLSYTLVAMAVPLMVGVFFVPICRVGTKAFAMIGTYSLELYLVHEAVFRRVDVMSAPSVLKFVVAYGVSFGSAWILKKICDSLIRIARLQ